MLVIILGLVVLLLQLLFLLLDRLLLLLVPQGICVPLILLLLEILRHLVLDDIILSQLPTGRGDVLIFRDRSLMRIYAVPLSGDPVIENRRNVSLRLKYAGLGIYLVLLRYLIGDTCEGRIPLIFELFFQLLLVFSHPLQLIVFRQFPLTNHKSSSRRLFRLLGNHFLRWISEETPILPLLFSYRRNIGTKVYGAYISIRLNLV